MAYRVFVSHVWRAQHEYYWGLIRLLANAKRFRFVDLSIPKLRPLEGAYIDAKDEILSGLRSADVVLVINTPVLTRSAAVQDELAEAKRCGIPIIAIKPPNRQGRARGSNLDTVVGAYQASWTTRSIVEAIRLAVRDHPRKHTLPLQLAAEQAYEPSEVAVEELPAALAHDISIRGDDEDPSPLNVVQTLPTTLSPTPRDALFKPKPELGPMPPLKLPWFKRPWFR